MRSTPGKRWRHVIVNTHNTWLHGDLRGFRNREHRIHSSGDYRNPPPADEHAGLRAYHEQRSGEAVRLPYAVLQAVGEAVVENLGHREHDLAAIAIATNHLHMLVELPDHVQEIRTIIGWCKYFGTRAARNTDPSLKNVTLWAEGETYKPVDNADHWRAALRYIAEDQGSDAWVWIAPFTPTPAGSDPTPQESA